MKKTIITYVARIGAPKLWYDNCVAEIRAFVGTLDISF